MKWSGGDDGDGDGDDDDPDEVQRDDDDDGDDFPPPGGNFPGRFIPARELFLSLLFPSRGGGGIFPRAPLLKIRVEEVMYAKGERQRWARGPTPCLGAGPMEAAP